MARKEDAGYGFLCTALNSLRSFSAIDESLLSTEQGVDELTNQRSCE